MADLVGDCRRRTPAHTHAHLTFPLRRRVARIAGRAVRGSFSRTTSPRKIGRSHFDNRQSENDNRQSEIAQGEANGDQRTCAGSLTRARRLGNRSDLLRLSRFGFRDTQASLFPRSPLERRSPGADFKRLEPFRILLVEFLVVRLGWIKLHRRQNFRHDRLGEFARVRQLFL
jgi:hypothetical protein